MLSKIVLLMALHLWYIHSNCRRWKSLFWKSFTHLPSSFGEALLCQDECQRDLPEAGQQLANISERQGQQQGQCLQMITHVSSAHTSVWEIAHTTNLTSCPDGIFTDLFIYLLFFFWTEINQGPMLETGKLHKSQQWNKLGTMPNSDGLGGLLHSVHVKISSCKEFPAKHTGCFYYRVGGIWYSIPIGRGSQWTRHYSTATSLGGHCLQKHTSVISCTAQSHI